MLKIRPLTDDDIDSVVEFALDAWEPVFDSMARAVGPQLFRLLFGRDWRIPGNRYPPHTVHLRSLGRRDTRGGRRVRGSGLPVGEPHGEIYMIAVAPDQQSRGVGTALTTHAVEHIRTAGRGLALVETGGDSGHAAARATYQKAGFVSLPAERYYLAL